MCCGKVIIPSLPRYKSKIARCAYKSVMMPAFSTAILFIIILNTFALALDRYPPLNEQTRTVLDLTNVIFTIIFTFEAIIKMVGLGFKGYFRDKFNIFDLVVVIISLIEMFLSEEGGAVSALRAFRLFRIFKIFKMGDLRVLLDSIVFTLTTIGNYVILLVLFIYVYSLLGM